MQPDENSPGFRSCCLSPSYIEDATAAALLQHMQNTELNRALHF